MSQKIVACYKWVLDEADVSFDKDLNPDMSKARPKISEYDRNAIEAAVQLADEAGEGLSVGLTVGDSGAASSQKEALARGLSEAVLVDTGAEAVTDYVVLADALAAGIGNIGEVSVVVCSEGSSDQFGRQTAPRLAAVLDWPVVTAVTGMSLEGDTLRAVRKLEDVEETVEVPLPCVVAVLPEINSPEMPGMRAILDARKKPSEQVALADLAVETDPAAEVTGLKGYQTERKNIVIDEGSAEANVAALLAALRKEGVA
ncbi:electron transfer flavoprotein [Adlercreutzia sp. R7]|uniref:Electron transfer flavoprotein small subunit n=1 Tax=Adlercreutzia wanghongyangiae TaxID=3111451 RepID=A0ABU6IKB4_9ACTN|nr:electron transfer flavoprotein [Adlercreutzia sp. R7]